MCRLLAYSGPDIRLNDLLFTPEHSLMVQSYRPREMSSGVVNADGFGVAWYDAAAGPEPGVYKSVLPIWADANLVSLGRMIRTPHLLAYIRSATVGQPTSYENTQPFVLDRYSFVHNGFVGRFRESVMRRMREALPDRCYRLVQGSTDSEHLFATWLSHLGARAGADAMEKALELTLDQVQSWATEAGVETALTMIVSDGETLVAVRSGSVESPPSLYLLERSQRIPGATVLASERLWDGEPWLAVTPHRVTRIGVGPVTPRC